MEEIDFDDVVAVGVRDFQSITFTPSEYASSGETVDQSHSPLALQGHESRSGILS